MSSHPADEAEELEILARAVERSCAQGCATLQHLSTPLGREVYRRKADRVAALFPAGGRLLDWGCGYGQMSFLLRNRSFDVVSYTIETQEPNPWNLFLREVELDVIYGSNPIRLPFDDASFDVALSCGVLEHVEDERASLGEVRRVLRPGGKLIVMMLPNRWSWSEFLARCLLRLPHHERLYTMESMLRLLAAYGFSPLKTWYWNAIPKNLGFLPEGIRQRIASAAPALWALDTLLCRLPPFRWFSGVVEGAFLRDSLP